MHENIFENCKSSLSLFTHVLFFYISIIVHLVQENRKRTQSL